jgi:hypothetical protein
MSVDISNVSGLQPAHGAEEGLHLGRSGRCFYFTHTTRFNFITFMVRFVGIRYVSGSSGTLFQYAKASNLPLELRHVLLSDRLPHVMNES